MTMFAKSSQLEAPNQRFIGHRDQVTQSMARYHFVASCLSGTLLEIGCGRGYGFEVMRKHSMTQCGLDISLPFLHEARAQVTGAALVCASGDRLPLCSNVFDAIVAFEVIEHVGDEIAFLNEVKRVARNPCVVAISTPNRSFVSGNSQKPLNRFHVREYYAGDFQECLNKVFSSAKIWGQHERSAQARPANRLLDHIPVRWKYMLPIQLQGLISVALRPPLRLSDCLFESDQLDQAHTFVALCQV